MAESVLELVKRWLVLPPFVQNAIMKEIEQERADVYRSTTAELDDPMPSYHPEPFQDFSTELRDPWPVVERLRMALREAERYCLGAENITGHCIRELLDRLPTEDD